MKLFFYAKHKKQYLFFGEAMGRYVWSDTPTLFMHRKDLEYALESFGFSDMTCIKLINL